MLLIFYGERKELLLTKMLDECLEYFIKPETLQYLINQETENLFVSLHTKSHEWAGEQEWRFCVHIVSDERNLNDFDFATAIYLGDGIEEEWK